MKLMKKNTTKILQKTFPNVSLKEFVHSQEVLVPRQIPMPIFSFFLSFLFIFQRFYRYLYNLKVFVRQRPFLANDFSSTTLKGLFLVFYRYFKVF